jgi:hypothetical protein
VIWVFALREMLAYQQTLATNTDGHAKLPSNEQLQHMSDKIKEQVF